MFDYLSNNQKHIVQGPLMDVYQNSNPFHSSGSTSTVTASTTIYGTTNYPPFPLPDNTLGGFMRSMGSSGHSSVDSTTLNISAISSSAKSPSTTPYHSSNSSGRATTSTIATVMPRSENTAHVKRKRERLNHLTAEQKLLRRKDKNRLAAQAARERAKAKQFDLELTVARLTSENVQLQSKLQAMESEHELVHSTRSISNTCAICELLHQQHGHDSRDNNLVSSSMADNWFGSSEHM